MSEPTDAVLLNALGAARVRRRPSPYRTSFPIEEVDAELADGSTLALMLKRLDRDELTDAARDAKPAFVYDQRREIETYETILSDGPSGPPRCQATGDGWLLIERVAGRELFQVGEIEVWEAAARWLGGFQKYHRDRVRPTGSALLDYDAAYYLQWAKRAAAFAPVLERLATNFETVVRHLTAWPRTVIHGEFYASNVIAAPDRCCPIDWEMAGFGPGLLDLAALVAGGWSADNRSRIVAAYQEVWAAGDVAGELDWFRLHLAVQWVGWSERWTPPREHAHDWLTEALTLADQLGV